MTKYKSDDKQVRAFSSQGLFCNCIVAVKSHGFVLDAHSAFPAYLESTNGILAARYSLCLGSVILCSKVAWTEVCPIVSNTGWWYGGQKWR
jgi:hypothetical protein